MSAVSCALRFKSRNSQKKMANGMRCHSTVKRTISMCDEMNVFIAKLLQKSEMRKDIVIELSYKGFG